MDDALLAFWVVNAARYLWNLSYLRLHPLIVLLGTQILDVIDTPFLKLSGKDTDYYIRADKAADASYYLASLIYFAYFYHGFRWHPLIKWSIVLFFGARFIANVVMVITAATIIPLIVWNVGQTLVLIYSIIDWFRWNEAIRTKLGWNILLLAVAIAAKAAQEFSMWLHFEELGPPECDTVLHCLEIWYVPALYFFFIGIWAGIVRLVEWFPGKVEVRGGMYKKVKAGRKRIDRRLTLADVQKLHT